MEKRVKVVCLFFVENFELDRKVIYQSDDRKKIVYASDGSQI